MHLMWYNAYLYNNTLYMITKKERDYLSILAEIAEERNMNELGSYIRKYSIYSSEEIVATAPQNKAYNITVMPEATCDGCQ